MMRLTLKQGHDSGDTKVDAGIVTVRNLILTMFYDTERGDSDWTVEYTRCGDTDAEGILILPVGASNKGRCTECGSHSITCDVCGKRHEG
jgi:hypothetical protein